MNKNRLEAFSDGVFAIIITIMVLELRAPHGDRLADLGPLVPAALSYLLSFIYVAIYWINHHHLFQVINHVSGPVLWANASLLFWLSLVPFVTDWAGENHFSPVPVALYGGIFLLAAISYYILTRVLLSEHGSQSELARAMGNDFKGKVSVLIYAVAIPMAFLSTNISLACYVLVAAMWIIPDRRIERVVGRQ